MWSYLKGKLRLRSKQLRLIAVIDPSRRWSKYDFEFELNESRQQQQKSIMVLLNELLEPWTKTR
jgi:hypothetical protein